MNRVKIENMTSDLLKQFKLFSEPVNVNKVAKKLGIRIDPEDLDNHISGYILMKKGIANIGLNRNHPQVRQRFTIAHEIGHYKLHSYVPLFIDEYKGAIYRSKEIPQNYKMEKEANAFAASLLMPSELISKKLNLLDEILSYDQKVEIMSKDFNVSEQAMDYRLRDLGYYDYGF